MKAANTRSPFLARNAGDACGLLCEDVHRKLLLSPAGRPGLCLVFSALCGRSSHVQTAVAVIPKLKCE